MMQTPALDFLRKVEVWQKTEGGTSGVGVAMPTGEETTLSQLLGTFRKQGPSTALEEQARYWLIGYRETEQFSPTLTTDQKSELDGVIAHLPAKPIAPRRKPLPQSDPVVMAWRGAIVAAVFIVTFFMIFLGGPAIWHATHPANNVPQGPQFQEHAPAAQIPPGATTLQNFKADWGPWKELPVSEQNPYSGSPALLFMEQGKYSVSENWTIPADSPAWTPDMSGNVGNVNVEGTHASITDRDGNPHVVGIGQPFVFSQNPGTVLMIDPTGQVLGIPEYHAVTPQIRHHLP